MRIRKAKNYLSEYWTLYLLIVLPLAYFIIFRYTPMAFLQIAVKDFKFNMSAWEMPWATTKGQPDIWKHFRKAFSNRDFWQALKNTLTLNLLDIIVGFPAPIIMALLLNELPFGFTKFKKFVQTVSYMPHFLSWIIIASLATQLFATTSGLLNLLFVDLGLETINFLGKPTNWMLTYCFLGVWQNLGWGSIIYLAAITTINPELYEAASVDGAKRFARIWHITLPGIRSTIVTLLILAVGGIVASNFDRPYALRNMLVTDVSDVLSIFVYLIGFKASDYSVSTAVGLFSSVFNVIFLLSANTVAKRLGERGVW